MLDLYIGIFFVNYCQSRWLLSQNWTSFEGNSCSDVNVDTCIITCGDTGEQNVPTLSICQTECELDELCNSWTYDTNTKVGNVHYFLYL